jgi:hypothetical protein
METGHEQLGGVTSKSLVVGIDIGIRNLAFCVIDPIKWALYEKTEEAPEDNDRCRGAGTPVDPGIILWKNVNLMDLDPVCQQICKSGVNKGKLCGKKAKWIGVGAPAPLRRTLSETNKPHSDNGSDNPIDPTAVGAREPLCGSHRPRVGTVKKITKVKVRDLSMPELIKRATIALDAYSDVFKCVETVVIELQPKINPFMKEFSSAMRAYFVIRYQVDYGCSHLKTIKFSSSKNKLKVYSGPEITCNLTKYKRTKMLGQLHTECILQKSPDVLNDLYHNAKPITKKDDLADAFLHCVYAIKRGSRAPTADCD